MFDFHTHIIPPDFPDFNKLFNNDIYISLKKINVDTWMMYKNIKFRKIQDNCLYLEDRLKDMNERGIEIQVLSCVPIMFSYDAPNNEACVVSKFINDFLQYCVKKYPKRFMALGTLPMQDVDNCLKTISVNNNLIGYQIGSNINGLNLDNPKFEPIYKKLEENNLILFVHPWNMMGQEEMKEYWLPWLVGMPAETSRAICSMIFGGIFDKFSNLKVVFAHGGGCFCGTLGRIEHGYNVRPDLCATKCNFSPKHYCGKFYVDSLVHSKDDLHNIIRTFGEDNVLLGTDYPFPLGESNPRKFFEEVNLPKNVELKIKKENLLKIL
jgi:aminocarboxymuconate-semialdehyde decarboxylase